MPVAFDLLTRRRLPTEELIDLWVHSGTGNDGNAGAQGSPLATTEEALYRLPTNMWGRRAVIHYLAGHAETLVRPLFFPPLQGAGHIDDVSLTGVDPTWDYIRPQVLLQAEPVTVDDLNGVITLADATVGLLKITDASKNWVPNEHVGRALINPGVVAEHGIIWSNTATELFVTSVGYSDGTLRIVRRDATLTLGDGAAITAKYGLLISAAQVALGLVGLNLFAGASAGPVVDIYGGGSVALLLCEVRGGFQTRGAAGQVSVDACYLNTGSYALNAGTPAIRQSLLKSLTANFHSVNGQYDLFGCRVESCGSMGHGGTSNPLGGFRVDQCWITGGTSHGVINLGGVRSRVTASRIDSCAGDAIKSEGPGHLSVQNVIGSGSTGVGVNADLGAHVVPAGTNTVAGAQGALRVGGQVFAWNQVPIVDSNRLCRIGA